MFQNDGTGVRGNMQAVITAILLDPEARDSVTDFANPQYGKVREPLLRYTEWARAFTAQSRTGSYGIGSTADPIWGLGQIAAKNINALNPLPLLLTDADPEVRAQAAKVSLIIPGQIEL